VGDRTEKVRRTDYSPKKRVRGKHLKGGVRQSSVQPKGGRKKGSSARRKKLAEKSRKKKRWPSEGGRHSGKVSRGRIKGKRKVLRLETGSATGERVLCRNPGEFEPRVEKYNRQWKIQIQIAGRPKTETKNLDWKNCPKFCLGGWNQSSGNLVEPRRGKDKYPPDEEVQLDPSVRKREKSPSGASAKNEGEKNRSQHLKQKRK